MINKSTNYNYFLLFHITIVSHRIKNSSNKYLMIVKKVDVTL